MSSDMPPPISICIPTYNRAALLAELLDSIVAQDMPEIEVIVSDDASPDDSAAVAERYRDRIPRLVVTRQPQNIGLDRNFLAVVALATGAYIWLMGDDDRIEPGGARRVCDALRRWPGVSGLTLGVIDYDPRMQHPTGLRAMPATQVLHGVAPVFGAMAEVLGFMSALVVDRLKWLEATHDPRLHEYENYYVQVYLVGRIIERYGSWGVVQEPCVGFRTSNDQFLTKFGWRKRLEIDVVAYDQIGHGLFPADAAARRAMRRRIFATHVLARLRNARSAPGRTPEILAVAHLLYRHYRGLPRYWTSALPTLLLPRWSVRAARAAYQRFAPMSGAARARRIAR